MKIDEALYQIKQNIKMHEIEGTTSNQNEREKVLLDYITNLQEENKRLNNIISEALGIANERINYYYHNKNDELLKEWEAIFEELIKRDTELKGDNK